MSERDSGNFLSRRWQALSPGHQRLLIIGLVGTVAVVIVYLFVTATPSARGTDPRDQLVEHILIGTDTRELGIGGLNNRTRGLEKAVHDLRGQLGELSAEMERTSDEAVNADELADQLYELRKTLDDEETTAGAPTPAPEPARAPTKPETTPSDIWEKPAPLALDQDTARGSVSAGAGETPEAEMKPLKIRVIGNDEPAQADEQGKDGRQGIYIPAASIISGVLITGMEAPTNNAAQTQPFPALVRVKKDAILPNRYRLDVRECFIIASGYGSLSAERAYLRAEVLSCVRSDGGVIEVSLNAYAVGEDGKVGLRGRVVSKQGQMLAKSLAAGFFSGMSQVFGQVPVPTIQTNGRNAVQYQKVLSSDSLTAGAVRGASTALDRLAEFYLDMAENIFPVIEINANRRADFVITEGTRLRAVSPQQTARQGGARRSAKKVKRPRARRVFQHLEATRNQ